MSNLADFVSLPVETSAQAVNTAYQDETNTKMSMNAILPKDYDRQSLNQLRPGEKTFRFSKGSLAGDCVVKLVVNKFDENAAVPMKAERGWGYNYIRRYSYKYGNSREYHVDGQANLIHVMDGTRDELDKLRVLELGGLPINSNSIGADPNNNEKIVYIVLSLPHSGPNGHCCNDKIPYDTRLLQDDIEIKIQFDDPRNIYADYNGFITGGYQFPLFNAEVIMEKFAFVIPNSSISQSVISGGRNEYAFIYPNLLSKTGEQANITLTETQFTISISGWRQGNTISLICALLPVRDYAIPDGPGTDAFSSPAHHQFVPIQEIELIMDGQVVCQYKNDGESDVFSLLRGPEDQFPMTTIEDGLQSKYTTLKLSQCSKKTILGENKLEAGTDLVSKTLIFNVKTSLSPNVTFSNYDFIVVQNISASLQTAGTQNEIVFVR